MEKNEVLRTFTYTNEIFKSILSFQEYYLIKNNIIYKVIIEKTINEIFIRSRNYMLIFNENNLSILSKNKMTIDNAYEYLINIFEDNRAEIEIVFKNKKIKLILTTDDEEEVAIELIFNKKNERINDYFINEIKQLKNKVKKLEQENVTLKNELENLKTYHPNKFKLVSNVSNDSFSNIAVDNTFEIFNSLNDKLYLINLNINNTIICYDLNLEKTIKEINNYHDSKITNFRHFLDKINKRDLIMSISAYDNNIKITNVENWECILNLLNVNKEGAVYSACFLSDIDDNYIITSNRNKDGICEPIKVFNFNGKKVEEINNSNENIYFIDVFYDNMSSKKYAITGNIGYVKSFDLEKNDVYHIYNDNDKNFIYNHLSAIVTYIKKETVLIESCFDGIIRLWDFHKRTLIKKIEVSDKFLNGICLWDENNLFVGCDDRTIKMIQLDNGMIIDSLSGHSCEVLTIKKIIHPQFGEFLISQNGAQSQIKMWKKKSNL